MQSYDSLKERTVVKVQSILETKFLLQATHIVVELTVILAEISEKINEDTICSLGD